VSVGASHRIAPYPPVLDLISSYRLLSPIGAHRAAHTIPSKGRRSKKMRQGKELNEPPSEVPPAPEIMAYVDVGLANISRSLQNAPGIKSQPYSVVFVARSGQSSAFNCHFPQLVAVASKSTQSSPAIRLVGLSKPCEEKLSAALGIPRVSCIALKDGARQAKGLIDYVRGHVGTIDVAWLEQAHAAQYQETKINAVPTTIGAAKSKRPQSSYAEP